MNEAALIQRLKNHFPTHIGDDAACFPFSKNEQYVISKDLLIENVHFRLRYQDLKSLAYKSLQVNLSDLAAMGATPCYVLLGLSIPETIRDFSPFIDAFAETCKKEQVTLIGGDTTRSEHGLCISITMIGKAKTVKSRSTAQVNDWVCVIGNLGYAHIGFTALEQEHSGLEPFKNAFLYPKALLDIGRLLAQNKSVHSMMDLSDGLYIDLTRLCEASNLGATLALEQLPLPHPFQEACAALNLDPLKTTLTGGEDYGLLCTVDPKGYPSLAQTCLQQFQQPLFAVGHLMSQKKICFTEKGKARMMKLKPFTHFAV